MSTVFQIARLVAILVLLCVAAAIATPKGQLPLALRGLAKMVRRCEGEKERGIEGPRPLTSSPAHPSEGKRFLAFILVVLAVVFALI